MRAEGEENALNFFVDFYSVSEQKLATRLKRPHFG
jgi:hypothetical protein